MNLSPRAERVWRRLVQENWGSDLLRQTPVMPPRWAQVVDSIGDNDVKAGLAKLHTRSNPPTTRDFEEAMGSVPRQTAPNRMADLVAYVIRNYPLTQAQICAPWTWLHTGSARAGDPSFAYTAVRIPPDPKTNTLGFTVDFGVLG